MFNFCGLIFERLILSGLIWVLITSLGGKLIPPKLKKKLFVIIASIMLISIFSVFLANKIATVLLMVSGVYLAFSFLCK